MPRGEEREKRLCIVVSEMIFHDLFALPPDKSGRGERYSYQIVLLIDQESPDCLSQSEDIILTIPKLLHCQIAPRIQRDPIVIVIELNVLYFVSPSEIPQTHVREFVAAAELDPVIHITAENFPPLNCKHLLRAKIIDPFQITELIR